MQEDWRPNPGQQELALRTVAFEILYGGARGGGKTEAGIIWLVKPYLIENPRYRALVIRRNAEDLVDWVDRASFLYSPLGVVVTGKPPEIRFPSGAKIRTGHLKDELAFTKYQGHEYQRMVIEELNQIPEEKSYLQLLASCRSTVEGIEPRVFCTTNPGGLGHSWVKSRFVDVELPNKKFTDTKTGLTRIYIPARIDDNPPLVKTNPGYVSFLEGLKEKDEDLYKAWRLGSWETFAGQFFREFNYDTHTVHELTIKESLQKFGGMDWGRTAPFCFLAVALQKCKFEGANFNRLWVYDEVYGTDKNPKEWATIIKSKVNLRTFSWIKADPSMFTKQSDGSISIADQFIKERVRVTPASNDRIGGWVLIHNWLSKAPDGLPYLMITENCRNLIRTLPLLQHDTNRVEDVDTDSEDHAPDALRYIVKHLKWIDAKLGGIRKVDIGKIYKFKRPFRKTLDLEAFAKVRIKKRDWRSL